MGTAVVAGIADPGSSKGHRSFAPAGVSDPGYNSALWRWRGARFALALFNLAARSVFAAGNELPNDSDHDYAPPLPGSYALPVIRCAADGALIDYKARPLSLTSITSGRVTVLSFIYTRCGDARACPYASSVLNRLHLASVEDGTLAKNLRLVSMSFDPEYDTPERLAEYASVVRDDERGCEWNFVTPRSASAALPILSAYGQVVDRKAETEAGGPLNHIVRVFLIDRHGRIRNIYSTGTLDPRLVLADVKTLLMEDPVGSVRDRG